MIDEILSEHKNKLPLLNQFASRTHDLLKTLLQNKNIHVHDVSFRIKTAESLREKITRPDKNYQNLGEITDLVGLRVITYLSDQVDTVTDIVEQEFKTDPERSIDKRSQLAPNVFGYTSVHKICTLHPKRSSLAEYSHFNGMWCEIQIRSILQHAWAEIEHDLGYKSVTGTPELLKRRFSKLSALLELADDEFLRIRNDISAHQSRVRANVASQPKTTPIDTYSLQAFIDSTPLIAEIEEHISKAINAQVILPSKDHQSKGLEAWTSHLHRVGIDSIDTLNRELNKHKDTVKAYGVWHFGGKQTTGTTIYHGAGVFMLALVLIGKSRLPQEIRKKIDNLEVSEAGRVFIMERVLTFFTQNP